MNIIQNVANEATQLGIIWGAAKLTGWVNPGQALVVGVCGVISNLLIKNSRLKGMEAQLATTILSLGSMYLSFMALGASMTLKATFLVALTATLNAGVVLVAIGIPAIVLAYLVHQVVLLILQNKNIPRLPNYFNHF